MPQCFPSEYAVPGLFVPLLSTVSVRFLTDLVHKNSKNNAVNLQFKVYETSPASKKKSKQYKNHIFTMTNHLHALKIILKRQIN